MSSAARRGSARGSRNPRPANVRAQNSSTPVYRDFELSAATASVLSGWLSTRHWRNIVAGVAAAVVVASMSAGLVRWLPWAQVAIVSGVVAALIASSPKAASVTAMLGIAAGLAISSVNAHIGMIALPGTLLWQGFLGTVFSGLIAAGTAVLIRRLDRAAMIVSWAVVALIIANLWASTMAVNALPRADHITGGAGPSFNEQLEGARSSNWTGRADQVLFSGVARDVMGGKPYYESYRTAFMEWTGIQAPPSSVTNVRFPLMIYIWGAVSGKQMVVAFLLFASLGIVAVVPTASAFVKLPLAIPASAALAAYFMHYSIGFEIFVAEAWAVSFAILATASFCRSLSSDAWRMWVLGSVFAAALAVLLRETMVFVMVAGVVSASVVAPSRRRFHFAAWGVGFLVVVLVLALHYLRAAAIVDTSSAYVQFQAGGVAWMISAFRYGTNFLGDGGWVPLTLAFSGVLGILLVPDRGLKTYVGIGAIAPLVMFLFVANPNVDPATTLAENYWGAAVLPLLFAYSPWLFLLLPGMASKVTARVGS